MLNEASVTYKAYLYEDGNESEIRKFSVDRDAASSFTSLKEKIVSLFPALAGKTNFNISWKDEEGDMITIGTDDELMIFLQEVSGVRKIFISAGDRSDVHGESSPLGAAGFEGNVHPGVICDGCNNAVVGHRYKCTTCPNFDLCASCEGKSLHPEHFMLRIPVPVSLRNHHFGKKLCKGLQKSMRRQEKWNARRQHCPRGENTAHDAPWAQTAGVWVDTFAGVLHDTLETFGNFAQGLSQPESQPNQPNREAQTPTATEATPMESEAAATPAPSPPEVVQNTSSDTNTNNERGWVLVDGASSAAGRATQSQPQFVQSQPSTSQQPTAPPTGDSDNSPRNEKVEQALEKMLAMGFNNEGGWLRQMLTYKNGSIEDVLDILLPMRKLSMRNN